MIQEGDILKAKPKHFIPRQEGVVGFPKFTFYETCSNKYNVNVRVTLGNIQWLLSPIPTQTDMF